MKKTGLTGFGKSRYSPIGLDIGSTSVKMAQLKKKDTGWEISGLAVKEIDIPKDENGQHSNEDVADVIKECMKGSSFSGKSVVSVMPGSQLDIFPVKFSLAKDESVEDAILEKARAHLSYDVKNAVIDYIPFEDSEHEPGTDHPLRSLLISARREDVDNQLAILKRAKLKPAALDISACALARLIRLSRTDRNRNVLVVNTNNRHTSLTLIWKNNILLDRTILWGRENVVESLMNRLKLDRQNADGLLVRKGLDPEQGNETEQDNERNMQGKAPDVVYPIIANQIGELTAEIDKMLRYFSSEMRGAVVNQLYLMGTASMIQGLNTYMEKRIGIVTDYYHPSDKLHMGTDDMSDDSNGVVSFFGVPVGLAIREIPELNV
ncbi:MAG: type IV pilus assembly protein PilM [Nitrospiraceae bacterium]|nr:MAG: type IV pilus assembly protein PilM [Nitrospiraceae bacterium]